MWAAKYNTTPSSPVNHRSSTEFLTTTKKCDFSNFNLQGTILLSHACLLRSLEHRSLVVRALERYSKDPGSSPGGDACFSH